MPFWLSACVCWISFPCSLAAGKLKAQHSFLSTTLKFCRLLAALCCLKHCFQVAVSGQCCKIWIYLCWINPKCIRQKSEKETQERGRIRRKITHQGAIILRFKGSYQVLSKLVRAGRGGDATKFLPLPSFCWDAFLHQTNKGTVVRICVQQI